MVMSYSCMAYKVLCQVSDATEEIRNLFFWWCPLITVEIGTLFLSQHITHEHICRRNKWMRREISVAMRGEQFDPCLLSSIQEDLLIKKILKFHDPNHRYKIDAAQLLLLVESTMHFISPKVICLFFLHE